jgi:hypothetical protein
MKRQKETLFVKQYEADADRVMRKGGEASLVRRKMKKAV